MKVESSPDVHTIQPLDQAALGTHAPHHKPAAAAGIDELANVFSQEAELNSRALSQRSMGVRVPPVELLAQLYDQLGHPAQATLASVARRVRLQLLQSAGLDAVLALTGSDPARAYVVLKQVTAEAETDGRKTEASLAHDALAKLEIRYKHEIQAGLNTAQALQAASGDPQERQALRALYYASVVARQSLASMMQALLGVYGSEQFALGLKVMRRALADDIAAHTPSVPTARLRTLLLGLQSCGQLGGVLASCKAVIQRLNLPLDAVLMLQRLLGYAGAGITPSEVQRLATEWGGEPFSVQLVALNALYPLMQSLPLALWRDSRARQEVLHHFLVVMDEFTRLERGRPPFNAEPRAQV